jgi:hypothetical protein
MNTIHSTVAMPSSTGLLCGSSSCTTTTASQAMLSHSISGSSQLCSWHSVRHRFARLAIGAQLLLSRAKRVKRPSRFRT